MNKPEKQENFVKRTKPHLAKASVELEEEILEETKVEDPEEEEAKKAIANNRRGTV